MQSEAAERIARFQAELWHKNGGAENDHYQDTTHHILKYAQVWGIWGVDHSGNWTDLRFTNVREAVIEGLHLSSEKRVNLILYRSDGSIAGRLIRY